MLKSFMPSWLDADKTMDAMSKRQRRSSTQFAQDTLDKKVETVYREKRYKTAYKQATLMLEKSRADPLLFAKKGNGIRAVVEKVNTELLPSPNDKKLTRGAVTLALKRGYGVSPLKKGVSARVPIELTKALATHTTMMQVSGDGEASSSLMRQVASAVLAGTEHDGKINVDYLWRKTRQHHPEILNPVRAKNHENRRVDWLTYKNLIDWNKRAKQFLIEIGMAADQPGIIREYFFACIFYLFDNIILFSP